jgi:hypothetical protein
VGRATKAEHEQRIEQVCQLLIQGAQRRDVINWALGRWDVGERQVDKYIHAAHERIAQSLPADHAYEIALSLRRHTLVWAQAYKDGRLAVADKAVHEIDVLRNLRAHSDQTPRLDPATLRKNMEEIATEILKNGALDGPC